MKKIMSPGGTTVDLQMELVLADNKKIYSAESFKSGVYLNNEKSSYYWFRSSFLA